MQLQQEKLALKISDKEEQLCSEIKHHHDFYVTIFYLNPNLQPAQFNAQFYLHAHKSRSP